MPKTDTPATDTPGIETPETVDGEEIVAVAIARLDDGTLLVYAIQDSGAQYPELGLFLFPDEIYTVGEDVDGEFAHRLLTVGKVVLATDEQIAAWKKAQEKAQQDGSVEEDDDEDAEKRPAAPLVLTDPSVGKAKALPQPDVIAQTKQSATETQAASEGQTDAEGQAAPSGPSNEPPTV